jgi:hypothetical protein
MNKRIAAVLSISLLSPSLLLARGNHPMAGCGLAYVLFSKDQNTREIQILASTTNNSFGSQSFGITTGTMGCTEDGAVRADSRAAAYAEVNFRDLSREMAAGRGEYVTTFAALLGAKEESRPALVKFFHDQYAALIPSADTTSAEMLSRLNQELSSHPELLG